MLDNEVNLAFLGDLHGSIIPAYTFLNDLERRLEMKLNGVIQVGDYGIYLRDKTEADKPIQLAGFEFRTHFPKLWNGEFAVPIPTWVCPGNHEEYAVLKMLLDDPDHIPNFHLLGDGEITNVLGVRVGAIWGNYSPRSYANPKTVEEARQYNTGSKKALHIYRPAVEHLAAAGQFDVLVSHDAAEDFAPAFAEMNEHLRSVMGLEEDENHVRGCPGLTKLYQTGRPDAHYFGHFHTARTMQRGDPRIICLHSFDKNAPASVEVRTYSMDEEQKTA